MIYFSFEILISIYCGNNFLL